MLLQVRYVWQYCKLEGSVLFRTKYKIIVVTGALLVVISKVQFISALAEKDVTTSMPSTWLPRGIPWGQQTSHEKFS